MEEIWKDIPGYEGHYQANNFGEIRSLNYRRTGKIVVLKKRIDRDGYYQSILCKNGVTKVLGTARLIAKTFIPNPNNLPQVNHKDENKTNNFVFVNPDGSVDPEKSNLEWCTLKYNINYGERNEKVIKTRTKRNSKTGRKGVLQIKNQKILKEYPSISDAALCIRGDKKYGSQISAVCRGRCPTAFGYKWEYKRG